MLQLVLLVYAEENSINLNVFDIIIILISGTFTEFKKTFSEDRQYLQTIFKLVLSVQVGPEITRLGCFHRKDKQWMRNG